VLSEIPRCSPNSRSVNPLRCQRANIRRICRARTDVVDPILPMDSYLEPILRYRRIYRRDGVGHPFTELLMIRGLIKLKRGDIEQSEIDFRDAIAFAQRIGAKSWELRATMSLASILQKTERREEARMLLSSIYDSFSEGFDTVDLRNAGAFLADLKLIG